MNVSEWVYWEFFCCACVQLISFILCCLQMFTTCYVHTAVISAAGTLLVLTSLLLNPAAPGSEVWVSLLARSFYLIKVQPKWNLSNTRIWSQPGLCSFISDVLWLRLRAENQSIAAAAAKSCTQSADKSRLTNNQWNYTTEHHIDSTSQTSWTQIKT